MLCQYLFVHHTSSTNLEQARTTACIYFQYLVAKKLCKSTSLLFYYNLNSSRVQHFNLHLVAGSHCLDINKQHRHNKNRENREERFQPEYQVYDITVFESACAVEKEISHLW